MVSAGAVCAFTSVGLTHVSVNHAICVVVALPWLDEEGGDFAAKKE